MSSRPLLKKVKAVDAFFYETGRQIVKRFAKQRYFRFKYKAYITRWC